MKPFLSRKEWPMIVLVGVLYILSIQIAYSTEGATDEIAILQMQAEDLKKSRILCQDHFYIEKVIASKRG